MWKVAFLKGGFGLKGGKGGFSQRCVEGGFSQIQSHTDFKVVN